jgi:hypothetical protein
VSGTGSFGNVGIGTTTPGPNLEIFDSNAGARSTYVANTLLGLERNGQAFINIIGGAMSLLGLDSVILERRPKVAPDTTTIPTGFPSSPPMSRAMTSSKLGSPKTACVNRHHARRPRSVAHQMAIHRLATRQRHQHFTLCHHCDIHEHPRHLRCAY